MTRPGRPRAHVASHLIPARSAAALAALLLAGGAMLAASGVAEAGSPADGVSLQSDAGPLTLADYRGRYVYVDFFASWCTPCRASFPFMNDLAAEHAGAGLEVLAIGLDTDPADGRAFAERLGATFDVAHDPSGASAEAFDLRGMPSSYLLDPAGRVVWSHTGFRAKDIAAIEAAVRNALGSRTFADADGGDR